MSNQSSNNKKPLKPSPASSKAPAAAAAAPKFVVLDLSTAANNNANNTTTANATNTTTSPLKAEHAGTVARSASLHDQLAPEDQEDLEEALDMDDDDEPQQKSQKSKPQQQQPQPQPVSVDQKTEVKAAPISSFSKSGVNDDEDRGVGDVQFSDSTFWKSNYTFGDLDLDLELEESSSSSAKASTSFYTPSKSYDTSVTNTPSSVAKETSAPPCSPAYFVKLPIIANMSVADKEEHAADEKRVTYVDSNFWRQGYAYDADELEEL